MSASTQQLLGYPRSNRIIKYNAANVDLRFSFPDHWPADAGTSTVALSITDTSGTAVLALTAATLWNSGSADAIASAISKGDVSMTLSTGVTGTQPGDLLILAASIAGPSEVFEVSSYDASGKIVYFTEPAVHDHGSGAAVYGRFARYQLDTSADTDTYSKGKRLQIRWGTTRAQAAEVHEMAEVRYQIFDTPGLEQRIQHTYPQAWRLTEGDYLYHRQGMLDEFNLDCRSNGQDMNDLMDTDLAQEGVALLYAARAYELHGTSDRNQYEAKTLRERYNAWWKKFAILALWWDGDQNDAEADTEIRTLDWNPQMRNN